MKQRFEYYLMDLDSKIAKKLKIKKKNKYTLKQAESVIAQIQNSCETETTATVRCVDVEDGATYDFDGITITPASEGGKPVALFSEIEDQILQVDESILSDPNKLILDINAQYKSEPDVSTQALKRSKPKKGLFSLFSKNKQQDTAEDEVMEEESDFEFEEEPISEEVAEFEEEPEEIETESTPEEVAESNVEEVNETEDFEFEEEVEEPTTSSQTLDKPIQQYQLESTTSSQNDFNSVSLYPQPVIQQVKKHETVILPKLQEYCDLGKEIEISIENTTNKLKPENLFKFIGIPADKSTRLNEYKVNYAMQKLSEVKFENLREHYFNQVSSLKAEALDSLKTAVNVAWTKSYDLEVEKYKKEQLLTMETTAKEEIQEFVDRQTKQVEDRIAKFESEQQIALQNFKAKQEAEKNVFVADEQERSQNLIDSKTEAVNKELEKQKETFFDEEMYKLKIKTNQQLFDGKRKTQQEFAINLSSANEDIWNKALEFITQIQEEIETKTPVWASEIKETNILEQQAYQMEKEQKEMKLKEESLAIKRLEAETNLKRMEELEHENKMLQIKLETAESKNELYQLEQSRMVDSGSGHATTRSLFGVRR